VPFCHWQTYIDPGSPTLRWFSCISTSTADETFYATSVTNHLLPAQTAASNSVTLTTGDIAGIAVAGGVTLVICAGILAWCCVKRRKNGREQAVGPDPQAMQQAYLGPQPIHELHSSHGGTEADYFTQPHTPKQAYYKHEDWKQAPPIEAQSTPVAELPADYGQDEIQHGFAR
jgi:hypothetical protein